MFRIEIADGDHGHQIGAIPVIVERAKLFRSRRHDTRFGADRKTLGVSRSLERDRKPLLKHAVAGALAAAPLLAHDAALVHDFVGVERLAVRPVLENRERLIDDARGVGRNRKDVDRLVEARVRVEVGAEAHADRLEVLDEVVLGEVRRAVERRVLEEVGESELVGGLENRSGVDDEAQLGALLRARVLPDVVSNAVRQRADADFRIDRQLGAERIGRMRAADCCAITGAARASSATKGRALSRMANGYWGRR